MGLSAPGHWRLRAALRCHKQESHKPKTFAVRGTLTILPIYFCSFRVSTVSALQGGQRFLACSPYFCSPVPCQRPHVPAWFLQGRLTKPLLGKAALEERRCEAGRTSINVPILERT